MGNPFQDQLLKAGVVTKKQVHKAKQDKNQQRKKQRSSNEKLVDTNKLNVKKAAEDKSKRDRELNKKKQKKAQEKAIAAEINQLITDNLIKRDANCEIVYNFEHNKKIRRIIVNEEIKAKISNGTIGIARIEGGYELVPKPVAEKIQQRNAKRVILFDTIEETADENDPYADYEIPDDLNW